ncbi:MAG: hypothetical protein GY769_17670 [bacterium]|nr:hypothetical protein [bacterium]
MKRIRPKPYVRVLFRGHNWARARWYWAIKRKPGLYLRVTDEGDENIKERAIRGGILQTQELLVGEPLEERPAVMNLHYGKLEEERT